MQIDGQGNHRRDVHGSERLQPHRNERFADPPPHPPPGPGDGWHVDEDESSRKIDCPRNRDAEFAIQLADERRSDEGSH